MPSHFLHTLSLAYLSLVDKLQFAIKGISDLSEESFAAFLSAFQQWDVAKDFHLLREGSISDYFYFLEEGAARIYYRKSDREVTEWIATEGQFLLSITSFFKRSPSRLLIHTLQPSIVYGIHHDAFMQLADEHRDIEKLLRKMVIASLILSQERMASIQFETAQQRYHNLIKNSPQLIQQIPLSYIASFLGVTLETLSRIRGQK